MYVPLYLSWNKPTCFFNHALCIFHRVTVVTYLVVVAMMVVMYLVVAMMVVTYLVVAVVATRCVR